MVFICDICKKESAVGDVEYVFDSTLDISFAVCKKCFDSRYGGDIV